MEGENWWSSLHPPPTTPLYIARQPSGLLIPTLLQSGENLDIYFPPSPPIAIVYISEIIILVLPSHAFYDCLKQEEELFVMKVLRMSVLKVVQNKVKCRRLKVQTRGELRKYIFSR